MADRGRRHHQIAEDLRISPRTLQRWLKAYRTGGLAGLRIQWAPGRAPRLPDEWAPAILRWVQHVPAGCGLDRANWTAAAHATCLYHPKGIAVSERTMRAFCTNQDLKGDPQAQETAGQDEARFAMIPTLRTTFGLKGHRPLVGNLDCHGLLDVFGALNLVTGRLTTRVVERPRMPKPTRPVRSRRLSKLPNGRSPGSAGCSSRASCPGWSGPTIATRRGWARQNCTSITRLGSRSTRRCSPLGPRYAGAGGSCGLAGFRHGPQG